MVELGMVRDGRVWFGGAVLIEGVVGLCSFLAVKRPNRVPAGKQRAGWLAGNEGGSRRWSSPPAAASGGRRLHDALMPLGDLKTCTS